MNNDYNCFFKDFFVKYFEKYNIFGKIIHFPMLICCGILFFIQIILLDIIDILDYLFPTIKK